MWHLFISIMINQMGWELNLQVAACCRFLHPGPAQRRLGSLVWAMTVISMELIIILSVVRAVSGDTWGCELGWAGPGMSDANYHPIMCRHLWLISHVSCLLSAVCAHQPRLSSIYLESAPSNTKLIVKSSSSSNTGWRAGECCISHHNNTAALGRIWLDSIPHSMLHCIAT